jgi:hypothetical protein
MALVSVGFDVGVTLMDNGGNRTSRTFTSRATSAAEAVTASGFLLTALGNITDAEIVGYSVTQRYAEDEIEYPVSGIQIENQAEVVCQVSGNATKQALLNFPAPKPALFNATVGAAANQLNLTNAAVVAFLNLFEPAAGASGFTISDGETISNAIVGRRIHRRSRNG